MDLETIRTAARVREFQEALSVSPEMSERLAQLKELSEDEKKVLMADAFKRALEIAKELTARPEYSDRDKMLDLSEAGLGKIQLILYEDDGEPAEADYEGSKPFDGISVDPSGIYLDHHIVGELMNDAAVYVNRDGTISSDNILHQGHLDELVHTTLEYLETLEVIQAQLAEQQVAAK